jgi:hypothetical protein
VCRPRLETDLPDESLPVSRALTAAGVILCNPEASRTVTEANGDHRTVAVRAPSGLGISPGRVVQIEVSTQTGAIRQARIPTLGGDIEVQFSRWSCAEVGCHPGVISWRVGSVTEEWRVTRYEVVRVRP